ncbi:polysaccharide lyase 6 family protein [Glaciecola sp. XM2]|uniref:polysaccharide lyase 6 family protein n=1 Tax=Glaciecola sp. XM2 TaxID=1914931 RepID=UPI001BDF19D3|nr:polysaccharide lyase 6 family protein [Glaciecola sp. XM2]MBT1450774.1 polysaccharide lyase 6 family protein [Glaciecola sp. XM2]
MINTLSKLGSLLLLLVLFACSPQANEYYIDSKDAFFKVASDLKAGDTLILKDGVYVDFEILLRGNGTENSPITLKAETPGKVILSGQSNLRLAGQYLVASGLVFKNGYTPSSSVIEFRESRGKYAYHSRVSNMVIDNFNNPDKQESDYWVALYGKHNRFNHNHLVGKRNKGVTVAVRLNSEASQENYHRIDHNYFGYRPTFGSNGGETLRIGTSHFSLTDSFTQVENNYFEKTNGEVEIISVKSGSNTIRGNVFYEARGTLTMRHGNGNIIENNVFLGNGIEHTGGIRVINKDQTIRNNYLEGLGGYRFGSGLTVLNGVPNSPINRYHQVDNALIENNSLINVEHIHLGAGSDAERSAVPINSKMAHNLIYNENNQQPFTLFDDMSGIVFEHNDSNVDVPSEISAGFQTIELSLVRAENGLLYPSDTSITSGVSRDLTILNKNDTGVAWYPKTPATVAFDSGKVRQVSADASALLEAIENAGEGDVIEIAPGDIVIPKLAFIDKTLTIKAAQPGQTKIGFERSALFEIRDGGSLKLQGLHITGESSPDSHGNTAIRTKKWGMVNNYRFEMHDSVIENLDVNHSFHFFSTGKGAFADKIMLSNNTFTNVTGDILQLNTESEDLGIYNAEYITLRGNTFTNIDGGIAKIYRGGTDESTFGPLLLVEDNILSDVGLGSRNKDLASFYLHGVQRTHMSGNTFTSSAPLVVEHTVGEPSTTVINNVFNQTQPPKVTELRVKGPHTAELRDNTINE